MRSFIVAARRLTDGLVVLLGLLMGSFALARMDIIYYRPRMGVWEWSHAFPVLLFALSLVIGSLAGMRRRPRAALFCLFGALVCVGSCLYGVSFNSGGMTEFLPVKYYIEQKPVDPFQLGALALFLGFPIIGSIVAFREHLRPRLLYPAGVFVIAGTLLYDFFRCSGFMAQILAAPGAVLAILGSFWLVSYWLGWPVQIGEGVPGRRQIAIFSLFCVFVLLLTSAGSLLLESHRGDGWLMWKCKPASPISKPQYRGQAVFIAKSKRLGGVNVLLVQKYFWGLPWWDHKLAFFVPAMLPDGQTYFVDGVRTQSLFTWFLPTVQLKSCTRLSPLEDAEVDLRVLRDGVPRAGVCIIERVRHDQWDRAPAPGVKVAIAGPRGTVITTTDEHGIYDISAVEPGHYMIRVESCTKAEDNSYRPCRADAELKVEDVWGETLWLPR